MRIAHVTDLHVLSRTHAHWREIVLNKRITGYANLLLHRARVHRRDYLRAVLAAASRSAQHVVVTGDITNLSLEHEYEEACALLDECAARTEVTVVPGNHDIYLPSTQREGRFAHHFPRFMASDLPELAYALPAGHFPSVKLRGPVAIIGLSSAVPRPPFVSAGYLGREQIKALRAALAHPEVRKRMPVMLIHHPPIDDRPRILRLRDGLVDAEALRAALSALARGVLLFGHLHVRVRCTLRTSCGQIDVCGASGGALDHPDPRVRAGFNLYEFDMRGNLASAEAHVLDPSNGDFHRMPIAQAQGAAIAPG